MVDFKKNVALVLSGGGARGIAHIGVIEQLEKQGFNIKSISGTSMGALVGGIYSLGKLEEYKKWMCTLDEWDIFKLIDFTFNSQGLIKGERVFQKMQKFIPNKNIEDLKINFSATATDIINRKEIIFTKGNIREAIRASIAIPTIFTPVKTKSSVLVDGGVLNNIPIQHVKRTEGDILIVVHVNADVPAYKPFLKKNNNKKQSIYIKEIKKIRNKLNKRNSKNKKLGYFEIINKTIALLTYKISKTILKQFPPDILINVSRDSCGVFDFYKAEELIEIGKHSAIESLKRYKQ